MVSFSWRRWLRTRTFLIASKRRTAGLLPPCRIEGLEERTLLTAPVAVDDSAYVVNEDATLNAGSVLGNDTDVDADITGAAVDTAPSHAASFTFNATDGTFTYTPVANFRGTDTFTYHAIDGTAANSNIATVTITVGQLNDAGTFGGNTSGSGAEDANITGVLTFTDAIDGFTTPNFSVSSIASHGTASINPTTGAWTYSPTSNYNGPDSFTVSVTDNDGNIETQVISLTVNAVNDVPVANAVSFSTAEDTQLANTLTGSDADANPLTFHAGTIAPSHGTVVINPNGTFTYTPAANSHGGDAFTFFVNDGTANSQEALVKVSITSANDAPVVSNVSLTVLKNNNLPGTLTSTDADGDSVTFAVGTVGPSHGTVVIRPNGTFTYTPATDYFGPDSFTYKANDGTADSAEATVSITVSNNILPVATPGAFTTNEDTPHSGSVTATDANSDPLTYHLGTVAPAHGTVTINPNGTFTYTPAADFHGADSFSFYANDGTGNSPEATIAVTITSVNDAPVANAASFSTNEDTPQSGAFTSFDLDADTMIFSAGSIAPAHGTVTISPNGSYVYTPAANFSGTDSFTFKVNDGTVNSADATVTVTVNAVNDLPTVTNGTGTVAENGVLTGSVATLGTDAENEALTFAAVTQPTHGSLTFNSNGTFTYTPTANYSGTDSFTFKANDSHGDSTVATFNITVTAVDAPLTLTLPSGPAQVARNSTKVQLDPAASVTDPDTNVNYANAQITATIQEGGTPEDSANNRFVLSVINQGTGTGLVKVKGSKIYFNGSTTPVASFTGGTKGQNLVITFTGAATEQAVNAVLKQISVQASKKASTGSRTIGVQVTAQGQSAQATKTAVVI